MASATQEYPGTVVRALRRFSEQVSSVLKSREPQYEHRLQHRLEDATVGSLERLMENRTKITPFIGTGATIAVLPDNPFARWDGLLEDGIRRCAELGQSKEWAESTVARLRSGDLITYLGVADEVSRRLTESGEWRDWIKRTVGTLKIDGGSPIHEAICSLNRIVLTTNYDRLLEDASAEHESLHWKQYDKVLEAINVDENHAVIHLHGVATNPDSVVLGSWQYQKLQDDHTAQTWQEQLLTRRLLFIGCGAGLNDPNIGSALEYVQILLDPPSRKARSGSEPSEPHENYILVRGCELGEAWKTFSGSNIYPVAFGPEYADLTQFLIDFAEGRTPKASQDVHKYETPARATGTQVHTPAKEARTTGKPGLLDLAGPAEKALQEALDVAQRALRAVGQVERRSVLPPGADRWAAADQLFIHRRMAESVMDPINRLQAETTALEFAVNEADGPTGLLTGQQDPVLDALFELVNELASACDDLGGRVAACSTQIEDHLKLTEHYNSAVAVLGDTQSLVNGIRETVKRLPRA
jgi:hypothetical protein